MRRRVSSVTWAVGVACVLGAGAAAAQPAYILSSIQSPTENRIENGYPQTIRIEVDRMDGEWRMLRYSTLLGSEQEPVRSQASNAWTLQYRGVPAVVRGGDHFRVEFRWQRVFVGHYQGKPYRHEASLHFGSFADCGPSSPLRDQYGDIVMPTNRDELAGFVDYSCGDVVRNVHNIATIGIGDRPAGGFNIVYLYHRQEKAPAAAAAPPPNANPERPGGLERGFDRWGGDYRDFDLSRNDPAECRAACASEPQCRAFAMAPAGMWSERPHCWLKSTVPPLSPNAGRVSGVIPREPERAGGLERGFDRWGGDFRDFDLSTNDPAECRAACASEPQCRAFAMAPAGMWAARPHCWLKSTVPPLSPNAGRVSGVIVR